MTDDLKKKRIEKSLGELKQLVDADPELKERTVRMLKDVQKTTAVRLPESMLEKIDEMAEKLNSNLKYAPKGSLNRSDMIRLAIVKGLEAIEAELKRRKN